MIWQAAGRFGGSIKNEDWLLLKEFFEKRKIKKVVEFGAGRSTVLMDALGLSVLSYETELKFSERVLPFLRYSMVVGWDGRETNVPVNCDLIFIDGPEGGLSREPAYRIAAESRVRYVACHDYQREHETRWREKWLKDFSCIKKGNYTAIYERLLPEP